MATPVPVRPRYASLDHWRGLACLLIVVYHATLVQNSVGTLVPSTRIEAIGVWLLHDANNFKLGVALFFVISGYCIAAAADGARFRAHGVREYFIRRFKRIYPPLWIVIVCSVVFFVAVDYWPTAGLLSSRPWEQPRPFWYSPSQWFGNLTLTETWRYHIFGSPRGHFPGQAWTLCYEEQFYLVSGVLAWSCRRVFFHGMLSVTVATIVLLLLAPRLPFPIGGFFFDGAWLLFAAGVGVYYRLAHARGLGARAVDVALFLGIPASWYLTVPIEGATIAFAFAAVLPILYAFDRQIASARLLRPLLVCGQMCYSLYLVHQLPIKALSTLLRRLGVSGAWPTLLITMPLCVAVSVGLGWLFHVTVERRFLNRPLASSAVALPLAV